MRIDMRIDKCIGICICMGMDMCIDMWIDLRAAHRLECDQCRRSRPSLVSTTWRRDIKIGKGTAVCKRHADARGMCQDIRMGRGMGMGMGIDMGIDTKKHA